MLRLSWSPDGQYLVSAHAMNNSGPTAQIIERDGWKTNMDFVGHRKAVTVVVSATRPQLFIKQDSKPKPKRITQASVCFTAITSSAFSVCGGLRAWAARLEKTFITKIMII